MFGDCVWLVTVDCYAHAAGYQGADSRIRTRSRHHDATVRGDDAAASFWKTGGKECQSR